MPKQSSYSRDALVEVAKMHYLQKLSQEEIAQKIHVSRPTVSRMLKSAYDQGIVQIRIDDVSSAGVELARTICDNFNVKYAIVVPSGATSEQSKINVGAAAAMYLENNIFDKNLVGISWGTTLYSTVTQMKAFDDIEADVIQLIGGIGSKTIDTDGNTISLTLAQKINGDNYVLQAPLIVQSKLLKDLLTSEPHIREHFNKMLDCNIALVGLGSVDPKLSAQLRSGYITMPETDRLKSEGAVGDICGTHYNIDGEICPSSFSDRTIAISLSALSKIPKVVGLVAGEEKIRCTYGALKGGYLDMVIMDEALAKKVINHQI